MPRKDPRTEGPAYPVRPQWQNDVRAELKRRGMKQRDLAAKIGCAQSTVSEALAREARQSSLVPQIHATFGWAPPVDPQALPMLSPDAVELAHMFERLPEAARRKLLDDAEFYLRTIVVGDKR
jgi:transcriptional regulator with XRE-family HTH domain